MSAEGTIAPRHTNVGVDYGTDDELSITKFPRVPPRPSTSGQAAEEESTQTPYASLRHLAGIIKKPSTPLRRASTTRPGFERRQATGTTLPQSYTPRARKIPQPASVKRTAPTTPHATRALQRRAATRTPAYDRRRSGRMQRETPRDVLKNLSRVLAHTTQPTEPLPLSIQADEEQDDELGNDVDIPMPRFSLNFGAKGEEDEDDSFHVSPLRLSLPLDDDNHSERSIELGRRAISEQPSGRLSRGSFGTLRTSDQFGDTTELQLEAIAETSADDSTLRRQIHNFVTDAQELDGRVDTGGDTQDLRRALIEEANIDPTTRSDLGPWALLEPDGDMTFALVPPSHRDSTPQIDTADGYGDLDDLQIESLPVELASNVRRSPSKFRVRKALKTSRRGLSYPSLPTGVVKNLSSTFVKSVGLSKTNIGNESLAAIMEASDWFFEQIGEDLGVYAEHAGRKKIDERDVSTVMKRQRHVTNKTTLFSLAHKNLPRELLQGIRSTPG